MRNVIGAAWQWLRRAARRFRIWRRGRPFWGGLLFMLAGGQLWLSTTLNPLHFEISFGPTGFLVILLPLLLVLCGLLAWVTPQHRVFYGVIGLVTAIYSLLGLNLGGWFVGMLLGILGGSLVVAWSPVAERSAASAVETETTRTDPDTAAPAGSAASEESTGPLTDAPPDQHQVAPVRAPKQRRTFVAVGMPLLLTVVLAMPVPAAAPADEPCQPDAASSSTEEEDEDRSLGDRLWDWWTELWDGSHWSDEPDVEPTGSPCPTPGPTPTPDPTPAPPPTPSPGPGPPATPEPPPSEDAGEQDEDGGEQPEDQPATSPPDPTPTPTPTPTPPPELPVPPDHPLVAAEPALLTADRLDLSGFRFEGIAELPTVEGTVRALKFTFSRATNVNFRMVTNRSTQPHTTVADPLVLRGDVEFYATSFRGNALGILPLTLLPDDDDLLLDLLELIRLPLPIFFTDVEQELVFTHGAQLTATGLDQH